jgi:hypothetical protein
MWRLEELRRECEGRQFKNDEASGRSKNTDQPEALRLRGYFTT